MTARIGSKYEPPFSPLRWYGARYFALIFGLLAVVGWGVYAYFVQFTTGLGVTVFRIRSRALAKTKPSVEPLQKTLCVRTSPRPISRIVADPYV